MTTPEERINAVWELTLLCLAWQGDQTVEPRLQRSVSRVQRSGRWIPHQDLADVEWWETNQGRSDR